MLFLASVLTVFGVLLRICLVIRVDGEELFQMDEMVDEQRRQNKDKGIRIEATIFMRVIEINGPTLFVVF